MNILLLLVPLSVVLLGIAIWAFAWAVKRGQFDDLDTPPLDMLADDERPAAPAMRGALLRDDPQQPAKTGTPTAGPPRVDAGRPGDGAPPRRDPDAR